MIVRSCGCVWGFDNLVCKMDRKNPFIFKGEKWCKGPKLQTSPQVPQQALPAGGPHTTRLPPSLTGCWLLRQPGGHSVQVHLKQLYFKVNQWVHHKYPYLSLIFLVHPIYYFIIRLIILLICVILCNGGGEVGDNLVVVGLETSTCFS